MVLDGRREQAEGGQRFRRLGHDDLGHPHFLREGDPVTGRDPQHEQGELARIVATLDRHEADLVGHPRIDHAVDSRGRRDGVETKLAGHGTHRSLGGGPVQRHEPAREALRIEVAQKQVASVTVACCPPRP